MDGRRMQGGIRLVMLAALLLLTLLGCGKSARVASPPDNAETHGDDLGGLSMAERVKLHKAFAHVMPPQAYSALAQLGTLAPSRAGAARRASVALPFSFNANAEYLVPGEAGYINKSVDVAVSPGAPPTGNVLLQPQGTEYPDNFSYVIYRIDDISQVARTLKMTCGASLGNVGVGVYNWAYGSLGRWEPRGWFMATAGTHETALDDLPGADFVNAGGDMAFVVFCLTPSTVDLLSFELSDVTSNQLPLAVLDESECHGHAPLTVTLDAGQSTDDGTVVNYRFDPEGHNEWIDNGAVPSLEYTYTDPGPYTPKVEVTDNYGEVSRGLGETVIVVPQSFDEVEDNDDQPNADNLTLPFGMYTGNVGTAGGYDGDQDDWYELTTLGAAGDNIQFRADYCRQGTGQADRLGLTLWDSSGDIHSLAGNYTGSYAPSLLYYQVTGTETPPFYLHVYNGTGFDYSYFLSGGPLLMETEDNDSPEEIDGVANAFTAQLVANHQYNGFKGSLGTGPDYQGYDGDDDDWLYFFAPPGATVDLTLDYDDATSNVGVSLFDGEGDMLVSSADNDGGEHIHYTIQPGDVNDLFFHLAVAPDGYSDYAVNATLDCPNPGYDETEDNDGVAEANPLPAFPIAGFTGNVGYPGKYDQDPADYLSFNASHGDLVNFTIFPSSFADTRLDARIADANGMPIVGSSPDPSSGVIQLGFTPRTGDATPYMLVLSSFSPAEDYTVMGRLQVGFNELENNDLKAQANPIPEDRWLWAGSLGSPGYDNDLVDWLSFDAPLGDKPDIMVQYDNTTGNFDFGGNPPKIYDEAGDVVATAANYGGGVFHMIFGTKIGINDIAPFYIQLNLDSVAPGQTSYFISRQADAP